MYETVGLLMGSIGENTRCIKILLEEKSQKIHEVQTAMDHKARTKTPLNERQQQMFHEFTGVYAREGGILQQSLMGMENTFQLIHTENTEAFLQSLATLRRHQHNAIYSLRRMIAFSEITLRTL